MSKTTGVGPETVTGADGEAGEGIAHLYARRRDGLRRLAYLMTGSAQVAEDVVQDAFARAHTRWATIDAPAAYVRATVVNLCIDWRRRAAMERERTPRPRTDRMDPPEVDEMWGRLAGLPGDQRVALVLRYYEDLAVDEIARLMGCPPVTVRTRIHRALTRLRQEMTP